MVIDNRYTISLIRKVSVKHVLMSRTIHCEMSHPDVRGRGRPRGVTQRVGRASLRRPWKREACSTHTHLHSRVDPQRYNTDSLLVRFLRSLYGNSTRPAHSCSAICALDFWRLAWHNIRLSQSMNNQSTGLSANRQQSTADEIKQKTLKMVARNLIKCNRSKMDRKHIPPYD